MSANERLLAQHRSPALLRTRAGVPHPPLGGMLASSQPIWGPMDRHSPVRGLGIKPTQPADEHGAFNKIAGFAIGLTVMMDIFGGALAGALYDASI